MGRDVHARPWTTAGETVDLLDALHIDQAVVGGLSMGGYVALAMFRLASRYFRGLLLADTRTQADTPRGPKGGNVCWRSCARGRARHR